MAEMALTAARRTLRVGELTRYIKYQVEQDELLSQLSVEGEVSDLSRSASGHVYFTLKDAVSQISCVLFRREALQQREQLEGLRKGVAAVAHGFLTIYEPRGTYQIYVQRVVVHGEGALFQQVERLRSKLESEGLFAPERKRPLPTFPRKLALITSPGSQAYHDVLHRLRQQFPFVTVIEAGASVQGDGAADAMAMALDIVNRLTEADVILLVRGGGAPEELAAFNEERLARAMFASRIPVVTGIGHETDLTIADMVADVRAATPSLAAAAAVPDVGGLVDRIRRTHGHTRHLVVHRLEGERRRLVALHRSLLRMNPETHLRSRRQRADELTRLAQRAVAVQVQAKRQTLDALRVQLEALDPLAILERGYALLADAETGEIISRSEQGRPHRRLRARVSDGTFTVRVDAP